MKENALFRPVSSSEEECYRARQEHGDKLKIGIGADAIRQLLEKIDLRRK